MKLKSHLINGGEVALIWRDLRLILGLVMNRRRSRRGRIWASYSDSWFITIYWFKDSWFTAFIWIRTWRAMNVLKPPDFRITHGALFYRRADSRLTGYERHIRPRFRNDTLFWPPLDSRLAESETHEAAWFQVHARFTFQPEIRLTSGGIWASGAGWSKHPSTTYQRRLRANLNRIKVSTAIPRRKHPVSSAPGSLSYVGPG